MDEIQELIASLTTAENTETIEQLLTAIQGMTTSTPEETEPVQEQENEYKTKYEELQRKYVERFLNGSTDGSEQEPKESETETEETEPEQDETEINDLFKEE